MQVVRLLLILTILITISCNNDPSEAVSSEGSSPSASKELSVVADTFQLPRQLKNAYCVGSFHDDQTGDALIFMDLKTFVLTSMSVVDLAIIDTIHIPSEYVQSAIEYYQDVRQYMQWHGPDTLIFMDDMIHGQRHQQLIGYSISSDSIFMRLPLGDLSNPKLNELFGRASNYLPVNWKSPEALMIAFTDFTKMESSPLQSLIIGQYHLKDSTVKRITDMSFPFLKDPHDYAFITEYFMAYNSQENAYLLASSLTPDLHLFHLDESAKVIETLKARPLSMYYEALPSPPDIIDGNMDYDRLEEIEITAYSGGRLLYHPNLNVYFRFYEKPQPLQVSEGFYSTYKNKEYGLMVLDNKLNILSEHLLGPGSSPASTSSRLVKNGIAYTTKLNEDNRELIIISLPHEHTAI